jgi:hypothetical protein
MATTGTAAAGGGQLASRDLGVIAATGVSVTVLGLVGAGLLVLLS